MSTAAASLERLHDIALPAAVPWWPLAPGWYAVLLLTLLVLAWYARRAWLRRRANAYRREALRELLTAGNCLAIAELLRRTAMAVAPRAQIAALDGPAWADWLAARCAAPMPPGVRAQLAGGVYARDAADDTALRAWAAQWIAGHTPPGEAVT